LRLPLPYHYQAPLLTRMRKGQLPSPSSRSPPATVNLSASLAVLMATSGLLRTLRTRSGTSPPAALSYPRSRYLLLIVNLTVSLAVLMATSGLLRTLGTRSGASPPAAPLPSSLFQRPVGSPACLVASPLARMATSGLPSRLGLLGTRSDGLPPAAPSLS